MAGVSIRQCWVLLVSMSSDILSDTRHDRKGRANQSLQTRSGGGHGSSSETPALSARFRRTSSF
jgi:hypothetical protein